MTLVVKLGSSVIATDSGALRGKVLASICDQVSELTRMGESIVLVTSGAIARGMWLRKRASRPRAMDELQAASAVGQADLYRAYERRLKLRGVEAAQVLLTRSDITRRENYRNARQTIQRLLQWGVVPIVNENDTTATDEITFGDNDFLAAQISILIHARLLILLTNTDGLFESDPRVDREARLVERVETLADIGSFEIGTNPSRLGRGGMGSKIAAAETATQSGIAVVICNGRRRGTLQRAAEGLEVGTRLLPSPERDKSSVTKLWLRHASSPPGSIYVDHGAAKRLRGSGSSLLAAGIVKSSGSFEAGDVVAVRLNDPDELIGRGVTEFSSAELKRIKGKRTAWIKDKLPDAPDEVIHRDRFALV